MKKNANKGTVSLTPSERLNNRLDKALVRLMRQHREDTTITVDELVDITNAEPGIVIDYLTKTKSKLGEVIEGRRGHPTRFVFGDDENSSWSKWIRAMAYRRQWRRDNGRDPQTGRLLRRPRQAARSYARTGAVHRSGASAVRATRQSNKLVIHVPPGVEVVTR